ncbi:FAD-binding protein [Phycicoccus endophyticus]|uniref:FAD-binding protein n=1 Tax=Phycicoccus endophyticus TaxID=1690220 RepID=A0A7G9QZG5_9MICO|nr:D-arabinono-1,4-lactone oxidase [Phycicoccus endophyticus]NHI19101.1 FAD-binding protein [Phycicoccus endophyticus]QNN48740.1 FAD-binding protein [Phycicoccus endophyticus]GGL32772.1 FAD-linked oxidoreductase [Phycicoccus endophyticus]
MSATWRNWGGNVSARPGLVTEVSSIEGVRGAVRTARERGVPLRVAGSGHSFTPLVATDGVLLRVDGLRGVLDVDRERARVRVAAGTPLHELNPALQALGLALPNLGDIDRQTLSGAVATGTHGTGVRLQGIAAAVCGLTLVLADGSLLRCSAEEEPEVFQAARVGLGALGVVVELELQCVPAFRLHARESGESFAGVLASIHDLADSHDHVDMHWFPHTDRVLVKRNDRVGPGEGPGPLPAWRRRLDDDLLANRVYEGVNRLLSRVPAATARANQLSARALGAREFADDSWRVFCSSREVRFVESEYAVPRRAVVPVLTELRAWFERSREPVPFPVEVRFVGADDVWLSTAYERDNAYVAVHQYHRMDPSRLFAAFEAIVAEHAGRPHWGKVHTLGAERLGELYPRFADVLAVRDRVDPDRRFTNDHVRHLLGD